MTPHRARRSRQTSSDLQCSDASNCIDSNARKPILLPTELVYEITTLVLSIFFAELFLGPSDDEKSNELSWDAVTSLLHSTCKFRACTTQLLRDLDDETFFHGSTRKIINYSQVLAPLRRLSQLVYSAPNTIFSIPQPSILKHRTIRQPRTRLARIAHYILMNAARTNAFIIYGVRRQKMRNETYSEKDLQGFQRDFMAIPAHVRYAILGRVIRRVVERLVVWERLLEFEDVVVPFFNLSMFFNPFHTAVANLPHGMLPGPTPVQPVPPEFYFLHFDLCAKFNIQFNDVPRITKEELTRVLFYHTVRELGHRGLGELGVVSTAQFKAQIGLLAEDEEAVVFDREFDPEPLSENFVYDIQVDPALDTFWGFAI